MNDLLNIYYVKRTGKLREDEIDSCIVVETSPEEAFMWCPQRDVKRFICKDDGMWNAWPVYQMSDVDIKLIGIAASGMQTGVVMQSVY